MRSLAVVDASPLVALFDPRDRDHARCVEVLARRDLRLVIPGLVITEVAYLAAKHVGPLAEARFIRRLRSADIEAPQPDDWPLIADMIERYAGLPLGTVDASIAVLADRLGTDVVITLDRRHFGAIRSPSGRAFRILPEIPSIREEAAAFEAARA